MLWENLYISYKNLQNTARPYKLFIDEQQGGCGILQKDRPRYAYAISCDRDRPTFLEMTMRCNHETNRGPCGKPARPGSNLCRLHTKDESLVAAYRISDPDLQDSVTWHAKASLLDISQQIVLLRSLVERRLNMADGGEADKIAAYNFVATQLSALTKMTETMVKLAKESGELMDRSEVESFVDSIVGIVADELTGINNYEQTIDSIVTRIEELE